MATSKPKAYSISCTARNIESLDELQPGDHIRVRGELGEFIDGLTPDIKLYTHHMLVVKVVSHSEIRVIHKTQDKRVVEELRSCEPNDVTVLDYDCAYVGQEAIDRARERIGEDYNLLWSNCEHFVTEVRTGTAQSIQVQNAVKVAVGVAIGVGVIGAAVGGLAYMFSRKRNRHDETQ